MTLALPLIPCPLTRHLIPEPQLSHLAPTGLGNERTNQNEHFHTSENILQTVEFYTNVSCRFVVCLPLFCGREPPDETRKGMLTAQATFRGWLSNQTALQLRFKICSWFSKHHVGINIHQRLGPLAGLGNLGAEKQKSWSVCRGFSPSF